MCTSLVPTSTRAAAGLLAAFGLFSGAYALPVLPADGIPVVACRLKLITMDVGATEYDIAGGLNHSSPCWLCCDPAVDVDDAEDECPVLYGEDMRHLRTADAGEIVTLRDLNYGTRVLVSSLTQLPTETRHSFGIDGRAAWRPSFVTLPGGRGGPGRTLQEALGTGATFIDRAHAHGKRNFLSVIVGSIEAGNGVVHDWGATPCKRSEVRKQMWGIPEGVRIAVGGSPFALEPKCKDADGVCKYNVRDHLRVVSRNAVTPNSMLSKELTLPVVRNWPANFCGWAKIWTAIKAAIVEDGTYNIADFNHVIAFVPKHCAIGQGNLPGKYVIVNQCPGTSVRDNTPILVAHELGHNLGFHHAGIVGKGEYDDFSSMMGVSWSDRTMSINMAHRLMFNWLPGLPNSIRIETSDRMVDRTFTVKLADPNNRGKPPGTKWAVEIHDGSRSWYVAYRGCTAYDLPSVNGWCGQVQISFRDDGDTHGYHHAFLSAASESISFGTANFVTATTLVAVRPSLGFGPSAYVPVQLRVART